ncbi:ribonuclease M5 [Halalkalibacterium halodurans]|uniref:Ribonuclease M5 n=1 Tax=Halalkalibacterium halodurans TaxID=86665 RepID=A0A0M0KCQ4_ALKHA|nr:ribonuclease M5 [Halalkalibacterium halodurans]TPE68538.1 ribonuclease M5 [Halalkalibacterium halodurans]
MEDVMKIKEMIVVEGRDDTIAIQRAVNADTIETNGSAVNEETLKRIALAQQRRGVIILTDPDYPGERIRRIVSERVPGCKHAFLPKKAALSKNGDDLGVENAAPEAIRHALGKVHEAMEDPLEVISRQDLFDAGLMAGADAKKRREQLGILLGIGYANGKTLYKRLKAFQITKREFAEAIAQIVEEGRD